MVSAILFSFSIKRSNETKVNGPIASQIIMLDFFFKFHIESYTRIGPGVDYPKTVDYILERNLMTCKPTKTAAFTFNR